MTEAICPGLRPRINKYTTFSIQYPDTFKTTKNILLQSPILAMETHQFYDINYYKYELLYR
jgi:hypothetical protein